ncbi:MAG: hypothetical protein AAB215_05315, partial [Planctomycetota bacterium]
MIFLAFAAVLAAAGSDAPGPSPAVPPDPAPFEAGWLLLREGAPAGTLEVRLVRKDGRTEASASALVPLDAGGCARVQTNARLGSGGRIEEMECWAAGPRPFFLEALRDGEQFRFIPEADSAKGLVVSWILPAQAAFAPIEGPAEYLDPLGPDDRPVAAAWKSSPDGRGRSIAPKGFQPPEGAKGLCFPAGDRLARPANREELEQAKAAIERAEAERAANFAKEGLARKKAWAEKARAAIGKDATVHEGPHFLILTDLGAAWGPNLRGLLEEDFAPVARELGLSEATFLADGPCVAVFLASRGAVGRLSAFEGSRMEALCARSSYEQEFHYNQDRKESFSRILVYMPKKDIKRMSSLK